jgi:diacylglycerol kinase family enzyme
MAVPDDSIALTPLPEGSAQSGDTPSALVPAFVNAEARNADDASSALTKLGCFAIERVSPDALAARVREEVARGARRVLIAGGDGSIASAAAALCGNDCELAILPAGTLNHLAKDLGLPEDLEAAARVAAGTTTRLIDVGEVNGRIFLNTSSVGAYVTFVRTRDNLERRLGYWIASIFAGVRILARLRTVRVKLEVAGERCEYDTPLVFIGVGERELKLPTLGKRTRDGRRGLHVMVIRKRSGARVLALALAAVARGVHAVARTPALDAFMVDGLRIEMRPRLRVGRIAVDGEVVSTEPSLEYHVRRDALKVVVGDVDPTAAAASG